MRKISNMFVVVLLYLVCLIMSGCSSDSGDIDIIWPPSTPLIGGGGWELPHANPEVIQANIKRLKDEDVSVRRDAALAFGQFFLWDPAAIAPLTEALNDEDSLVRVRAALALWRIDRFNTVKRDIVIPVLIEALNDEKAEAHEEVREEAHAHAEARWSAASALGEIGDPVAVPALTEALRDKNSRVRHTAAFALGGIGQSAKEAVPVLIEALSDESRSVRQNAALALGQIGDSAAVPALIKALSDEDEMVGTFAAEALKRIGTPEALQAVEDAEKE